MNFGTLEKVVCEFDTDVEKPFWEVEENFTIMNIVDDPVNDFNWSVNFHKFDKTKPTLIFSNRSRK